MTLPPAIARRADVTFPYEVKCHLKLKKPAEKPGSVKCIHQTVWVKVSANPFTDPQSVELMDFVREVERHFYHYQYPIFQVCFVSQCFFVLPQ